MAKDKDEKGLSAADYKRIQTLLRTKYPKALKDGIDMLATIQEERGFKDARSPDNLENLEGHIIHVYAHGGIMRYTLKLASGPEVFLSTWSKADKTFKVESRRTYRAKFAAKPAAPQVESKTTIKTKSPISKTALSMLGWPEWKG